MRDEAITPKESPPNSKMPEHGIMKPSLDSTDSATDSTTDSTTAASNTADTATTCAKSDATPFLFMKLAPELRIKIFEDFASSKGTYHTTMWTAAHQKHLSLLQSSSAVRREAAPIFYKEYLANEGSDSAHRWMLGSERLARMQNRVEALRQLAALYYPNVEVSARYMPPHFASKRVDALVLVR